MLAATLAMACMAIFGREAAREIGTTTLMFWRGALSFAIMFGVVCLTPGGLGQIATRRPGLHLLRNSIHFLGQYLWFFSLTLIPLAQVFALEFMMPLWITLLAPVLIGERFTRGRFASAAIGFVGVLMVIRPSMAALNAGTIAALVCAVAFALSVISVRAMTRTETAIRILFWMTGVQSLIALAVNGGHVVVPSSTTSGWIAALSVAGLSAQYSMARAFALADTMIVMPVDFLRLPLIAVVGALLYGEGLDPWVLGGGAVIIAGNLWNLTAERRAKAS